MRDSRFEERGSKKAPSYTGLRMGKEKQNGGMDHKAANKLSGHLFAVISYVDFIKYSKISILS